MPNGRHGDHPLTDILVHGGGAYPPDINAIVLEMSALPGFETIKDRVGDVLWDDWPHWQNVKPDFDKVRVALRALRDEIESRSTRGE